MKKIKVKYFSDDCPRLEKLPQGDWIDLRVDSISINKSNIKIPTQLNIPYSENELIRYSAGDVLFLGLGVAIELPKNHEAYLAPRSSMFKNTGLILTNGFGLIDEVYCGNNDEWRAMVYATRDGVIYRHDRLFQFRIQEKMPEVELQEVKHLSNDDRGGFGSTGIE